MNLLGDLLVAQASVANQCVHDLAIHFVHVRLHPAAPSVAGNNVALTN
jgi:hypothetical protein